MKSRDILIVVALVLTAAGTGRADFILMGAQHMDVTTSHTTGVLFDASTADVLMGGYIHNAFVSNEALLRVMRLEGAGVFAAWVGYSGRLAVLSGDVDWVYASGVSHTDICGGQVRNVYAGATSSVNISTGGAINVGLSHASSMNITGGYVAGHLYAFDTSSAAISGGYVALLHTWHASTVDISGGSVSELGAYDTSTITVHGYDFGASGGLSLVGDEVIGTGVLTGKWFDGTAWTMEIPTHSLGATIVAIPEPATLALLALGGLAAVRRRKS